jgi:hypothetical protein
MLERRARKHHHLWRYTGNISRRQSPRSCPRDPCGAAVPGSAQRWGIEVFGALQLRGSRSPTVDRPTQRRSVSSTLRSKSRMTRSNDLRKRCRDQRRSSCLVLGSSAFRRTEPLRQWSQTSARPGPSNTDISALEVVARQLHEGRWKGLLQLEEVDLRDDAVEKVRSATLVHGTELMFRFVSSRLFLGVFRCGALWLRMMRPGCRIGGYGSERVSRIGSVMGYR